MRHLLLLITIFGLSIAMSGCGYSKKEKTGKASADSKIIYGDDGRQDYFEITDLSLLKLARSTVAIIDEDDLVLFPRENIYQFRGTNDIPMCESEKFLKQPRIAYCSGSLIGTDLVLTAGHCVRDHHDCQSARFVFDYKLSNSHSKLQSVSPENVFRCHEIIKTTEAKNGADFAIIRLDRAVIGREPLKFAESELTYHTTLMAIGHPAGLPTKFTLNGKVRNLIPDLFFTASIDSFSGNSGSSVFDQQTGLIVGVLSRGDQDYERENSCYIAKVCQEDGCRGEDVTRISEVKKYLPKN
ncbi:MAG: trypsin-like peptidase domain-containing protein [Bdellovibrio sp.]|nr:trypsin-like peptidase domain-containing protein [Bdellovibrio sp.]